MPAAATKNKLPQKIGYSVLIATTNLLYPILNTVLQITSKPVTLLTVASCPVTPFWQLCTQKNTIPKC